MGKLVRPDVRYHMSWLVAAAEFGGGRMDGSGLDGAPDVASLIDGGAFAALVERLLADEREDSPRPEGHVPATSLWIVDDGAYIGCLQLRHRLTPDLLEHGGSIGYSVRPTARRRGHASAALMDALPIAAALGLDRVLAICDEDDPASRGVIEACGGEYEDTRGGRRRYWLPTDRAR